MKPGSIIVDLATSRGGNCEVSVLDQTIKHGEITIIGISNIATLVPATASDLYANNLVHLINLLAASPPEIKFNPEDEIVQQALLCYEGRYLPFQAAKEITKCMKLILWVIHTSPYSPFLSWHALSDITWYGR